MNTTNDFKYDVLEYLYSRSPNNVDIAPVIHTRRELTGKHRQYFRTILDELKNDGFITVLPNELFKLSHHKGGVYDDSQIIVSIKPKGIDEFLRMKKLRVDILNAERVYKTYKFTRIAAIIGFISGIILLILRILEALGISLIPK